VLFESSAQKTANIVEKVRRKLSNIMSEDECGISVRPARSVEELVQRDPFRDVKSRGAKLYVDFLTQRPRIKPRLPLVSHKEALEVIAVSGKAAFIVSRRKANGFFGIPNNFVEKGLGVPATSRNWTTVAKIAALVRAEMSQRRRNLLSKPFAANEPPGRVAVGQHRV